MWSAIRTELAYFRPWLVGAFAIAAAVITILSVIFSLVPDGTEVGAGAGLRAFFPIIAGMVVGFIAQALFAQERRARLLLAGALTPAEMGGVVVLLPMILFLTGALVAAIVMGVERAITGPLAAESLNLIKSIAPMFFPIGQVSLLAQESATAHRQQRKRESYLGWSLFGLVILFLSASQWILGLSYVAAVQIALGFAAMAMTWRLYANRVDFTS